MSNESHPSPTGSSSSSLFGEMFIYLLFICAVVNKKEMHIAYSSVFFSIGFEFYKKKTD
jgi:hypothetical protein